MSLNITSERSIQIVISLLKAHGIKKVIASPGGNDACFVASLQNDPWFEMYSEVDERSAAYIATGMAAESGEPVVITCTGATSSRNYMPALTEAFYRKIPVLAITCSSRNSSIGHLIGQVTDRTQLPADIANISVQLQPVRCAEDEWDVTLKANKAMLGLKHNGGGPCHINLQMINSSDFSVKEIKKVKVINRFIVGDNMPDLPNGRIGIFIGAHNKWDEALTEAVDKFCEIYNACVFCEQISNYKGKYGVLYPLVTEQYDNFTNSFSLELLIHIGYVANSVLTAKEVWRVNPDGEMRDTFKRLTAVFQMSETEFFTIYTRGKNGNHNELWKECLSVYDELIGRIPELPFSNIWVAQQISKRIPENSVLHFGIRNSLRSWNLFKVPQSVTCYCNTGGFGIDGGVSSLIGASLVDSNKLYFGVFGDLLFFYNLNIMGNRQIGTNVRIIVINNGLGQEFKNSGFFGGMFGEDTNLFIAAEGHFGKKSRTLLKGMAESLGFEYITAETKDDFNLKVKEFLTPEKKEKPMLFEIFTMTEDESKAYDCAMALTNKGKIKLKENRIIANPSMMGVKSVLKKIIK